MEASLQKMQVVQEDERPGAKRASKGKKLEVEFEEWLKKEGYHKTRRNEAVTGKVSQRHYDVDIHAVKGLDIDKVRNTSIILTSGIMLLFVYFTDFNFDTADSISLILIGFISMGVFLFVKKQYEEKEIHAWVECKNHASNVKRHQMQKLISSVDDVKESNESKWTPKIIMMVSGSNFDSDALNFAEEHDIECYIQSGKGFKRVD